MNQEATNQETRKRAAEIVLGEYLAEGDVRGVERAAQEAGRLPTGEEGRQLFETALSQEKPWAAILAEPYLTLTENDKDRLLALCRRRWREGYILDALEITGRKLDEQEFHQFVKQAIEESGRGFLFVMALTRRTGFSLTDEEKQGFLNRMIELPEEGDKHNSMVNLRFGLEFLGDWLPPEGAERLLTILEDYEYPRPVFEDMMKLTVLARGKITRDRILSIAASAVSHEGVLEITEKTLLQVTGEGLTPADYHSLFQAAMKAGKESVAVKIAEKQPTILKRREFTTFIKRCMKREMWQEASLVAKAAQGVGKLSVKSLKDLLSKIPITDLPLFDIDERIKVYAFALTIGIDPKEIKFIIKKE